MTFIYLQAKIQPQGIKECHDNSVHVPSIGIVNNQTANASLLHNSNVSIAVCLEANDTEQETSAHSIIAEPMATYQETLANSEIPHDHVIHLTDLDLRFGKTECV